MVSYPSKLLNRSTDQGDAHCQSQILSLRNEFGGMAICSALEKEKDTIQSECRRPSLERLVLAGVSSRVSSRSD